MDLVHDVRAGQGQEVVVALKGKVTMLLKIVIKATFYSYSIPIKAF